MGEMEHESFPKPETEEKDKAGNFPGKKSYFVIKD